MRIGRHLWSDNLLFSVNVFEMISCILLCNDYTLISCLETDSHVESSEKSKLSEHIDEKTEREIEKTFGKHRRKESAYSIQNVLWLITSIAVFYYTDFYIACRYDQRVNRWVNLSVLTGGSTGVQKYMKKLMSVHLSHLPCQSFFHKVVI